MGVFEISNPLPLITGLLEYAAKGRVPFHTPGHKGVRGLGQVLSVHPLGSLDVTELPGLDDLHQPTGIIAQSQAHCAKSYGAKACYFLVNGGSVGIQASLLSVLSPGEIVLLPRNAHKSVYSALILTGAKPVYYLPEMHPEFGLALGQTAKNIIQMAEVHPELKAVVVVYPTYYGTVWDLNELRKAWKGLIVADEAHGAHFSFSPSLPLSALDLGADLVVQSTHKTLGAFTQGAILHVGNSGRVSLEAVSGALDILQTTSPSYLIMASLESAVWDAVNGGREHWSGLVEKAVDLKRRLNTRGVRVLHEGDIGSNGIAGIDQTKILVRCPGQGAKLAEELAEGWGVQAELWDRDNILFLLGVGDCEQSLNRLEKALMSLRIRESNVSGHSFWSKLPDQVLTPREAFFSTKTSVPLKQAAGRVCGQALAPYPPGVPVVVAGEMISAELIEYIEQSLAEGAYWQGITGSSGNIMVVGETAK